ncbi:NAD+ synthase (glutamine-hydrolysing) [Lewinella marina]|uniref:Glutamine-dependent NAD(+) synthetase n=1 Tax=Neolewinella marina TaxID=438751 RepID=A0A2G0CER1_9BACT|nr:NAD+ synthase [Neolewinella marina]NJB87206.1 NAD+ synthase (glutamine-hydrolysing) [Neolewinella marina]PHK98466.1 NAD+ synthase [Neolewinella marina]
MNIALAQINVHVGNFDANLKKMLDYTERAKKQGADIVVFPELATVGYPPRDFLEFDDFIDQAHLVVEQLAKAADGIAIIVGSPTRNPVVEGKDLYNSAYFLANGRIQQVQHKTLLPTYDIFDEYRYFEPAAEWNVVRYQDKTFAMIVCEDSWNVGNENPLYKINPMDLLMEHQPDFIINISASPFSYDHAPERVMVLQANVDLYNMPMYYVNHVGAQTELIFDGGSLVINQHGEVVDEMPYFEECLRVYNTDEVEDGQEMSGERPRDKMTLIHDALVMGIRQYFQKLGFKRALLGLSGGIDSALVAVLAARALGPENVRCVLMPSQHSSDHSVNDARQLAQNLGCQYDIVPIESVYHKYMDLLGPHFLGYQSGLAEENLQARIRGMILMAFSNKFGNILLNTSNKSEMAVGYGTLYGDMAGGLSVIGDVYKTECFELARFINKDGEVIPDNIITKPPSAELRPDQLDSDSLPPYPELDAILYQYIELHKSPQDIIEQGADPLLVQKALRLVNINEFKRHQTAPVLRVSKKAFGMGRRFPIVAKYLS